MAENRQADIDAVNADLKLLADAYDEIKKVASSNSDITEALALLKDYYLTSVNIPQTDFGTKLTGLNEEASGAITNISNNILKAMQAATQMLNALLQEQAEWERQQAEGDG